MKVCSRKSRRKLIKKLRSRSDSGAFSPSNLVPALSKHGSSIPHETLVPALSKHESSIPREGGQDDRHAEVSPRPEPLGEMWGQPLEILDENTKAVHKTHSSKAIGPKRRAEWRKKGRARVSGGEEKGEDELVVAEEGRRHSRGLSSLLEALSWNPREKHHCELC